MIKKSISNILIILILVNSIGCYSYQQIKTWQIVKIRKSDEVRITTSEEEIDKFVENDEVKMTTVEEKVYYLHNVQIKGSKLKGLYYTSRSSPRYRREVEEVVIPIDQIKKIEIDSFDTVATIVTIIIILGIPAGLLIYAMQGLEN